MIVASRNAYRAAAGAWLPALGRFLHCTISGHPGMGREVQTARYCEPIIPPSVVETAASRAKPHIVGSFPSVKTGGSMRAFAVGAGQTADFGRSPRAVPLGSLDIFAGPVTPTRPRHLGVIKQGTAKGNNAGTQNAQNGAQICTRSPSASPAPAGVLRVLRSCVFFKPPLKRCRSLRYRTESCCREGSVARSLRYW